MALSPARDFFTGRYRPWGLDVASARLQDRGGLAIRPQPRLNSLLRCDAVSSSFVVQCEQGRNKHATWLVDAQLWWLAPP